MTTIADLAREFGAQPHEIAAFADLGRDYSDTAELTPDTEAMIREAWAAAHEGPVDTATENRNEEAVLDELERVVEDAGYDEMRP